MIMHKLLCVVISFAIYVSNIILEYHYPSLMMIYHVMKELLLVRKYFLFREIGGLISFILLTIRQYTKFFN